MAPSGSPGEPVAPRTVGDDIIADAIQAIGMEMETRATLSPKLLEQLHAFGMFINWTYSAIKLRLAGNIMSAVDSERQAEGFYKRLPEEWKW